MTVSERFMINFQGVELQADMLGPETPKGAVVMAHGRNNDLDHPSIIAAAKGACGSGWSALRFNFPYRQQKKDEPDDFSVLTRVHQAAVDFALKRLPDENQRLVMAGKSMGSRTALAAAQYFKPEGIILLGFPLHSQLNRTDLNTAPLLAQTVPLLIIVGERDPLCRPDLLKQVIDNLSVPVSLEIIPSGNHSFEPHDPDVISPEEVLSRIEKAAAGFMDSLD